MLHPSLTYLMNHYGAAGVPFWFLIDFEGQSGVVLPLAEIDTHQIVYDLNGITNQATTKTSANPTTSLILELSPVAYTQYTQAFEIVQRNILVGNSYLTNLSAPTPVRTNADWEAVFDLSQAKYKLYWRDRLLFFSPETFVKIQDGKIFTYPMKGTINQQIPNAAQKILQDPKEFAEHTTIVDLLRNDLSQVASRVRVARFRYIDEVHTHQSTLLQVSSEIVGDLPLDYAAHLGDIFARLLPAGSISGAPKRKTVEIIHEAEAIFEVGGRPYERGYYTGIMGIFDGQHLDSGVVIRYVENYAGQWVFKTGGGITAHSLAQAEYQEMLDKVYLPIIPQGRIS